jgi:hypothetical protein
MNVGLKMTDMRLRLRSVKLKFGAGLRCGSVKCEAEKEAPRRLGAPTSRRMNVGLQISLKLKMCED